MYEPRTEWPSGREVVLIYFGKMSCGYSRNEELTAAVQYFWRDHVGEASVPQIVLLERTVARSEERPSFTITPEGIGCRCVGAQVSRRALQICDESLDCVCSHCMQIGHGEDSFRVSRINAVDAGEASRLIIDETPFLQELR